MNTELKPTLVINSDPENIAILEVFLKEVIKQYDVAQEKYADILISLTEAVNNAIIHGNKKDKTKSVRIYHFLSNGNLRIKVCDQGKGFNPDSVQDPTCPECLNLPGGRGVFLMQQLCDEIRFFDQGTKVEMTFKLQ
jgi:serine/threonine-protein kinase RsbW